MHTSSNAQSAGGPFHFRPFKKSDQPAVRRLVLTGLGQRFGRVDAGLNPDLDDIQRHYVAPGDAFIVVERQGKIVGCGALIKENGSREIGRIVRVSVEPAQQGRGLGYAISRHLIDLARHKGFRRLLVETNADWESALRLYQGCGFREYARMRDERFGYTEVHMALDLDA